MPGLAQPVPADGALPASALAELGRRAVRHLRARAVLPPRCGYCDFNTYTAAELGPGASRDTYPGLAAAEIRLARRVLGDQRPAGAHRVLRRRHAHAAAAGQLGEMLRVIDGEFGLAAGAEVTAEANPETVDERSLAGLRAAGITRISLGMQSAVPHVLAVLDRVHEPGRPPGAPGGPGRPASSTSAWTSSTARRARPTRTGGRRWRRRWRRARTTSPRTR